MTEARAPGERGGWRKREKGIQRRKDSKKRDRKKGEPGDFCM